MLSSLNYDPIDELGGGRLLSGFIHLFPPNRDAEWKEYHTGQMLVQEKDVDNQPLYQGALVFYAEREKKCPITRERKHTPGSQRRPRPAVG